MMNNSEQYEEHERELDQREGNRIHEAIAYTERENHNLLKAVDRLEKENTALVRILEELLQSTNELLDGTNADDIADRMFLATATVVRARKILTLAKANKTLDSERKE